MSLTVYVDEREVGEISDEDPATGLIDFYYHPGIDDTLAVSLVMPPSADPQQYCGFNSLPPPFEISLPEGAVLEAIRNRLGKLVNVEDDLALLRLIGRRTVGRVSFGGPPLIDAKFDLGVLEAARDAHASERLAEILRESPQMFGISGVMPKMATSLTQRGTVVGAAEIIKFDSPQFLGISLVEHACLKTCARLGLPTPATELSPDASSIVIERFDVLGRRRLGFEDACALSGIRRTGKYNGSIEHLFAMIANFVAPMDEAAARLQLLRQLIVCDALRNGDAHMKNFGLVYGDNLDAPQLAPAYDIVTTQVWVPQDTPALPLYRDRPASGQWLNEESMQALIAISGVPGFDGAAYRAQCVEVAGECMSEVLAKAPHGQRRNCLARALEYIQGEAHRARRRR